MRTIAHITDIHLVEHDHAARRFTERVRLAYLNTGRSIDTHGRSQRLLQALRAAAGCDHIVLTGDLTEDGAPTQFELLAEVLSEARVSPERVTLVAGNHDLYTAPDAFERALRGPLRAYAGTSRVGVPIDLGTALLLPIATAVPQPLPLSYGALRPEQALRIGALASDRYVRQRPLIVAQHHHPLGYRNPIWNLIDGIENARGFAELLGAHEQLYVIHGHTHERSSTTIRRGRAPQVHSGAAIFDSGRNVRLYHAACSGLHSVEAARLAQPGAIERHVAPAAFAPYAQPDSV
jgi:3',5'-cyclic-AMP phosphodiesterase